MEQMRAQLKKPLGSWWIGVVLVIAVMDVILVWQLFR